MMLPGHTYLAESDARHLRIPAPRVATEPTEAQIAECEARLEATYRKFHAKDIEAREAAERANTRTVRPSRPARTSQAA